MRSQSERDGQTVTIATTLGLLVVVMLVGIVVLWLLDLMADPPARLRRQSSR